MGNAKFFAAKHALALVEDGMKLGLGTGTTSEEFVRQLAARVRSGNLQIVAVATSERTRVLAEQCGLGISELDRVGSLDLTVDGADEIDAELNLIKGGGGALLRERIVARSSARMVAIADSSKLVERLGVFPLPIEIVRFGAETTVRRIGSYLEDSGFGAVRGELRMVDGKPFASDENNLIVDWKLRRINDPFKTDRDLKCLTGVVETGLFAGVCESAIVGHEDGTVSTLAASCGNG
ncbi:MAG: ribose-5-phosphate isomerase RpiA [Rhodobacteraceae bacterium]|nr:ribose-5-phosphate isomerase RpiA [Paracoccaceae bacterium]